MKNRPIYKETFSRDFTLVNLEVWYRGEVLNKKIWTKERQPFLPYIIFEKVEDIVNAFYDPRGIKWIKGLLLEKVRQDRTFFSFLEKNFSEALSAVRAVYNEKTEVGHDELCRYLDIYENGYVWLEAAWWLWDMTEKELGGIVIPESFKKAREESQDYVPKSEDLIRKSLAKIYPEIADYINVLRISEIENQKIPDMRELKERKKGYYFADNKIFTGLSRKDIEEKYNIEFEILNTKSIDNFGGEIAYRGKVSGKVKIVLNYKNIGKVENGDVLVSPMTLPDFLPAIQKSAAIITDEGGMLSHAAIIARELKKPCIIGTKIATKVLKDGDLVEVNANEGVVKIIKKSVN